MRRDMVCTHTSPVVVNPVEGSGWRAHCLYCGMLGQVGTNSVEALDLLQHEQATHPSGAVRAQYYHGLWRDSGARTGG